MAQQYQLPEASARLSPNQKPSYPELSVKAERVARAQPVPQSSRTGDMSPAMRETLGSLGTAGQLAGRAMTMITQQISQRDMTQFQKSLQSKVDKMNDIAQKLGDNRDKMADMKGQMDALQTAMSSLQSLGCAAKDELDKLQQQYDDASKQFDDAQKNMQSAQDQLNRAQQDLQNQMNKSYPNTSQGRRQDYLDQRAAQQAVNDAEYNQSVAQGEMERTGYGANEAAKLRNESLESFGELQGKMTENANAQQAGQAEMQKAQTEYLNNVRDMQTTQREFAQTSRDMYETAMNQARIAQGGNTLGAVGSMLKDTANGDYWSAGAKAANQTLEWMKVMGNTGAATPALPLVQNIINAAAQGADRGMNAEGIMMQTMDAVYGHTNLMASFDMQMQAARNFANGDIGGGISMGMQSAYPLSQSLGTTATNFLPFTPLAFATPFANPLLQATGQATAAAGRSAGAADIYANGDRLGNAFAESALSPVPILSAGVGEFFDQFTGNPGLSETFEGWARDFTRETGDLVQEGFFDDLFKPQPNTSGQLRLDDNTNKQKTGNDYNTKNPGKSNPSKSNNNCPPPIKPRPPVPPLSGTGLGSPQ